MHKAPFEKISKNIIKLASFVHFSACTCKSIDRNILKSPPHESKMQNQDQRKFLEKTLAHLLFRYKCSAYILHSFQKLICNSVCETIFFLFILLGNETPFFSFFANGVSKLSARILDISNLYLIRTDTLNSFHSFEYASL